MKGQAILNMFIRVNAWVYFSVFTLLYFFVTFQLMASLLMPDVYTNADLYFNLFVSTTAVVNYIWLYAAASICQRKLLPHLKLNFIRFTIFYLISSGLSLGMLVAFNIMGFSNLVGSDITFITFILSPLYILNIISWIYVAYNIAKSIKMVELQEEVGFFKILPVFIAIIFLPVGILFIQSRLRKILKMEMAED